MKTLIKKLQEFFLKNWLSVVIILGLLFLLLLGKCNNTKLQKDNELKAIELSSLNDSVKTVVSKNGDLTFKLNSVVVEAVNNRTALEAAGFTIKDLKARDVEWRKVNFALKAQIQAIGSGQTTLHDTLFVSSGDTIRQANFVVNEKYLFFKASIINKDVKYNYNYHTGIDILNTPKGRNTNIISVYLSDPNAKVTNANSITITHKTKWYEKPWVWGLVGLTGGYFLGTK